MEVQRNTDGDKPSDTGYTHDGRADKDSYPHDGRADKDSYPHDQSVKILRNGDTLRIG